jgi:hypothetical protein
LIRTPFVGFPDTVGWKQAAGRYPLALVLLLVQTIAMAAEPVPVPDIEVPAAQTRPEREMPIEEIEIIGERSTISLLHEIRDTELQMFEMFNELNSTDDFDVTCRNVTHTGTLIPTWECDAGFMTRERFQNTQDFLQFGIIPRTDEDIYWENRHKVEALNAEMLALAKENPALARAMLDLHAKREQLAELESRKREQTTGFFRRLLGKDED